MPEQGNHIDSPIRRMSRCNWYRSNDLAAMEKRISENVTTGIKVDMKSLTQESMKDTMKEMIDNSLKSTIESMNAASKWMDECSSNMMSKSEEISSLMEENMKLNIKVSQLETEHDKLNRRLKQMEERSLDSNLIIKGILESKWEKEHEVKTKIYDELSNTIVANSEQERQQIIRRIGIKQCKRLGKFTDGQTRPLSVEFLLKEDAVYLLENRNNLRKGIYIDKEYSADIEYQRKLLRPILQAAKRTKGLEKKCKMQGPSLEIKGKKIMTKTLHKLPKELDVFTITSKKEGNVIGFFGELNALSNFHPAEFTVEGITFPTSEHYIQYTKAMTFGDISTATKVLNASTPVDCKAIGWKTVNFDKEKWDESAKALCYPGIRAKFIQNKRLLDTLLRTRGHILVEAAKDKTWGTGLVLSRDDWYDDTLWHSQGILGEMLCEIRDTYLRDHPETIVQDLIYTKRAPISIRSTTSNLANSLNLNQPTPFQRSQSYPELGALQGVPKTPVTSHTLGQNRLSSDISTTGSSPNLHALQVVPPNYPNAIPIQGSFSPYNSSAMDTLPSVPVNTPAKGILSTPSPSPPIENNQCAKKSSSLASTSLTPTQSALLKLSQPASYNDDSNTAPLYQASTPTVPD